MTDHLKTIREALENLQGLCSEQSDFVEQVTIWTPEALTALDALGAKAAQQAQPSEFVQRVNCDTCLHSTKNCDDYPCRSCGFEYGDGPFNMWEPKQAQAEAVPIDNETKTMKLMGLIDDLIEHDPDRAERFIESVLARNALQKRLKAKQAEAVPAIKDEHKRQWVRCRTCGCVAHYDYVPYSLSAPIMTMPCGHGAGERDMGADRITPEQAFAVMAAPKQAEAVPQWVDPYEKTPEDGQECLVYSRQHWEKAPSVKMDTWQEQHEAPLSFSSATIPIGVGWDAHNFEDVIAWMPLPAAPQPKEQSK